MSQGTACKCIESTKPVKERNWGVPDRHCNYSAFNGWRHTYSEYSLVVCLSCRASWRTKAAYVDSLADLEINTKTGEWMWKEGQ